jgi:hypothetical protein
LVSHLNPTTLTIGRTTIARDLQRLFCNHKAKLQLELQQHVIQGGRISLTTDTWSARNYSEYAAVTAHWISDKWQLRSTVLDVVELREPIHSGEYLAEQLIAVTDDYHITPAVFTVTRDNASANTVMLLEYENLACKHETTLQQPWAYTTKEGDVRCIGHIINLAVQAALTSLKAVPADDSDAYRLEYGAARVPLLPENESVAVLSKLRRHIYVFRNRRQWKDALKKQCKAANIEFKQLSLDMPVRWSSTYYMLHLALRLQGPITALCASQQLDLSMKDIALTTKDWQVMKALLDLFYIFIRPTEKLQGASYPTLNYAVVQYMRMTQKLEVFKAGYLENSTMYEASMMALKKLDEYYTLATNQQRSHSTIATICDPRYNFNVFDIIWPKSTQDTRKRRAKAQWQDCYHKYAGKASDIRAAKVMESIQDEDLEDENSKKTESDSEDELYVSQRQPDLDPEWKRWMNEPILGPKTDILKFWASKQYQYPILAAIAKDHLAIPATSAESERVFSVGGDIVTKKRNRLAPSTLRYLICLRNWGVVSPGEDSEGDEDA